MILMKMHHTGTVGRNKSISDSNYFSNVEVPLLIDDTSKAIKTFENELGKKKVFSSNIVSNMLPCVKLEELFSEKIHISNGIWEDRKPKRGLIVLKPSLVGVNISSKMLKSCSKKKKLYHLKDAHPLFIVLCIFA